MSHERFIRCGHCGMPHDEAESVCPATGKPIRRARTLPRGAQRHPHAARPAAPAVAPDAPHARRPPAPAPTREAPRDLVGRVIGDKYGVLGLLGEGGMGAVYEAEHLAIGRRVAVKVLHPRHASRKDAVTRFHHEARAAGGIGHPNICEIYDLGRLDDGTPFLVMERLTGETLADRIGREGALPFLDVVDTFMQMLSALYAAHQKGIVHRDIKPENIFLARRVGFTPLVKILDFGISKMADEPDLELTRTGMVMGTPYYMAPEQARGARDLDHRVDLFATGVILYEALTGRRPFSAPNYNALLRQILSQDPRPLRDLRPAVPEEFQPIVDRALRKRRDDRWRSAGEFLEALGAARDAIDRPSARRPLPDGGPPVGERAPLPTTARPVEPARRSDSSLEIDIHFSPGTGSGNVEAAHAPAAEAVRSDRPAVPDARPTDRCGPPLPSAPPASASDSQQTLVLAAGEAAASDDGPTEVRDARDLATEGEPPHGRARRRAPSDSITLPRLPKT